jgi:hypothetical protein
MRKENELAATGQAGNVAKHMALPVRHLLGPQKLFATHKGYCERQLDCWPGTGGTRAQIGASR